MRFIVFLLGLMGSLLSGFFGWFWLDYESNRAIEDMVKPYADIAIIMPDYGADFEGTARAALFLIVGCPLGMLGSLFTLFRRGRQGGVLMLLAVVGPAALNLVTLMFTTPLALAGLLSLLVRPLPAAVDVLD